MDNIDPAELWKTTIGEMQLQVTADIFEMYLQPCRFIELVDDTMTIAVPNQFVHDWLTLRLNRAISKTMRHIANRELAIKYIIVSSSSQLALRIDAEPADAIIRPGELRDPGYVRVWHDLRNFYGPMIGLTGIGLWTELRAHVNETSGHPLQGKAWPGMRSFMSLYREGRIAIERALTALNASELLQWQTGGDLIEIYQRNKARGLPDAQNPGISLQRLKRLVRNPYGTRIYTINDPLELPAFCTRFDIEIQLVDERPRFISYNGIINGRWSAWTTRIMQANMLTKLTTEDFRRMGLA